MCVCMCSRIKQLKMNYLSIRQRKDISIFPKKKKEEIRVRVHVAQQKQQQ